MEKIFEFIQANNISHETIAQKAEKDRRLIQKYVSGTFPLSFDKAREIAGAFGGSVEMVFVEPINREKAEFLTGYGDAFYAKLMKTLGGKWRAANDALLSRSEAVAVAYPYFTNFVNATRLKVTESNYTFEFPAEVSRLSFSGKLPKRSETIAFDSYGVCGMATFPAKGRPGRRSKKAAE